MQSYRNSISRDGNLVKDLLGVLLALVIGIGGLIVVADPVSILIPKHPMISSQDWPGSRVAQRLEIQHWDEYRKLSIILRSENDTSRQSAEIDQEARWYADMAEAAARWDHSPSYHPSLQISENFISRDNPASRLSCEDNSSRISCDFEAYRGHWYTQIFFWSESDELLSPSEIQQIVTRANQLLMSVSDEQIAAALPIHPNSTSLPHVIINTATRKVAQQNSIISTPLPITVPTAINSMLSLSSCIPFQSGETRIVSMGTFILGDIIIDEVEQYASDIAGEGTVAYFEKESIVTAPQGAACYTGSNDLINQIIQNELLHGCGSKCASVRFVLVQRDGQFVEIYK